MTKQLEGLCPHGRLTTAVCLDCGIEAEMYRPIIPDPLTDEFGSKQVNWKKESWDPLEAYYVPNAKPSAKQVGGDHYKDMTIQPAYFSHVNKLGALESNVVKYTCRHHQKGGLKDLEKARHYIDLLIEWEYGEETTS